MNIPRRSNLDDRLVLVGVIAALVVALLACSFLVNLISSGAVALVPLTAGALLLFANGREALAFWRQRQPSLPVMNGMIGLALIFFGVGTTIFGSNLLRFVFYGPALALLVLAVPMAIGRPSLYSSYGQWLRRASQASRQVLGGRSGRTAGQAPGGESTPRQTIELEKQDFYNAVTERNDQRNQG